MVHAHDHFSIVIVVVVINVVYDMRRIWTWGLSWGAGTWILKHALQVAAHLMSSLCRLVLGTLMGLDRRSMVVRDGRVMILHRVCVVDGIGRAVNIVAGSCGVLEMV